MLNESKLWRYKSLRDTIINKNFAATFVLPTSFALSRSRGCSILFDISTIPFLSCDRISLITSTRGESKLSCTRYCFFLHAERVWTLWSPPSARGIGQVISSDSSQLCSAGLKCLFFNLDSEN
jgi:hypothetical protein